MTNEEIWYCNKCNKEYYREDLVDYQYKDGRKYWLLCATCEDNINYIILHNINPCSTCVIKGKNTLNRTRKQILKDIGMEFD